MQQTHPWDWKTAVRSEIRTNLSNQVGTMNRNLTVGGLRVSLSVFDRAAMALGEHAISGPSFILRPPDPFVPTCTYIELAAHLARMSVNDDYRTDLVVGVVTPNAGLRTFHRRVHLGQHPGMEVIAPTEVVISRGEVHRYGDSEAPGATIFVDDPRDLADLGDIDLAIVDAPCPEMASVLNHAKHAIFVVRDASNYAVAGLASILPTFGWNAADVAILSPSERMLHQGPTYPALAARLSNLANGTRTEIVPVPAETFSACAAEVWRTLPDVMRAIPQTSAARELLKIAFGRYQLLMHLVVPMSSFKLQYGSMESVLGAVDSAARMVRGEAGDFYIPYLSELLRELASSLVNLPPKCEPFEQLVRGLAAEFGLRNVRIAAPNTRAATTIEEWLLSRGIAPEVVPLSALSRLPPSEHLVLTGMPPAWARHIIGSGVSRVTHVLCYARTTNGPPAEADLVNRMIESTEAYSSWMARPEAREICWGKLTAEPVNLVDPKPTAPHVDVSAVDLPDEPGPISLWTGLLESGALARGEGRAVGEHLGAEDCAVATAKMIVFSDGRWLLLSDDSWVTRLRAGKTEEGIDVSKLREGDTLVVIDSDPRKALLDKIVEQAAFVPEYAAVSEFARLWRDAMRAGYARFGTYAALNSALAVEGVNVTDVTVGSWVRGKTIGPQKRDDVRRVGVALGVEILTRKHQLICDAITTIRGIHVKLGVRIGQIALQDGVSGAIGVRGVDEIVDEHSGLTIGDFRRAVEFVKIRTIEQFGAVPVEMLGTMRGPDQSIGQGRIS